MLKVHTYFLHTDIGMTWLLFLGMVYKILQKLLLYKVDTNKMLISGCLQSGRPLSLSTRLEMNVYIHAK